MKTVSAKKATYRRDWYVVDATDKVLGRIATEIANRLRGKHKPEYTPHIDTGDYIVVVNADKVRVTGNKVTDKMYFRHTGYPGGIKETSFAKLMETNTDRSIEIDVKGMMPRKKLKKKRNVPQDEEEAERE